jgi:hypothetical protein
MTARLLEHATKRPLLELGPRVRLPVLADVGDAVSASELERFDACEVRWRFEYALRLRPKREPLYFKIGKLIHGALEAGYLSSTKTLGAPHEERVDIAALESEQAIDQRLEKYRDAAEDAIHAPELREKLISEAEEAATLARWILPRYWRVYADDLERYRVAEIERRGESDLGPRSRFLYVRDLVLLEVHTGALIVCDTKTTSQPFEAIELRAALDSQMTGYAWALAAELDRDALAFLRGTLLPDDAREGLEARLGGAVAPSRALSTGHVLYNVIRTSGLPGAPRILKDGTVSPASQNTTATAYRAALAAAGEPDWLRAGREAGAKRASAVEARWERLRREQLDRLEQLEQRGDGDFFRRFEFHRTPADLEDWRHETELLALRIQARRQRPDRAVRSRWVCSSPRSMPCPYRLPCLEPEALELLEEYRTSDPYERLKGETPDGDEATED